MRRILVERFRRKQAARHGGNRQQVPLDEVELEVPPSTTIYWLSMRRSISSPRPTPP
jgi:hypothetical protein